MAKNKWILFFKFTLPLKWPYCKGETEKQKLNMCLLQIVNDSCQSVRVSLEKVCELEGKMLQLPSKDKSKSRSAQKVKKKEKMETDKKSFSDDLTEDEIFSIENEFSTQKGNISNSNSHCPVSTESEDIFLNYAL